MHHKFRNMPNNMVWIVPILLLIVIVFAIYMIIKNNSSSKQLLDDPSIKTLDLRFARGEIDEKEYIRMKKLIKDNNVTDDFNN